MKWRVVHAAVVLGVSLELSIVWGQPASAASAQSNGQAASVARAAEDTVPTRSAAGVPAYVPAGSEIEADIINAARLLGIPLVRTARFPTASHVAFFSAAGLTDRQFSQRLRTFVRAGGRALLTSRLANRLGRLPSQYADRVFILPSHNGPRSVLALPQAQIDRLRNFALHPLGLRMEAPPRVSLTLLDRRTLLVENHNPFAAGVKLTFLAEKWPDVEALASDRTELPLVGSSVALQAPPNATQRFQIVSRP